MKFKLGTQDLKVGMYVAELDRPWLDTPFLMQGFLIQSPEHIDIVREHCSYVYIDPERSITRDTACGGRSAVVAPGASGA